MPPDYGKKIAMEREYTNKADQLVYADHKHWFTMIRSHIGILTMFGQPPSLEKPPIGIETDSDSESFAKIIPNHSRHCLGNAKAPSLCGRYLHIGGHR